MDFYSLILENRELIKIIYGLIIALICFTITLRANKLFKLSLHQGIRYFRNAFFFFGIAFLIRYIFGTFVILDYLPADYYFPVKAFFEFFAIMAGFFLLYSLIWRKAESPSKLVTSSLINNVTLVFYLFTLIIVAVDYIWLTYAAMFISQIIIFTFATAISFIKLLEKPNKKIPKFYFIAMLLSLITWGMNAIVAHYLDWSRAIIIDLYVLNILIFFVVLIGVVSVTKK